MDIKVQEPVRYDSVNIAKPKILIVTPEIPRPDAAAGDLRFFAMLQLLVKNNQIDLCAAFEDQDAPGVISYKQSLQEIGVNVLRSGPLGLEIAVFRSFYDIVLIEFWKCADMCMELIRRQQPQAEVVIDSVDMHFLREEAGLAFGISEASVVQRNKRQELKNYQQADMVVVVTQEDYDALIAEKITTALMIVPLIIPISPRKIRQRSSELLFVGGFRHPPNADGLLWFVNECWPAIQSRVPDVELTVVGSNAPKEIQDLGHQKGITIAGFVPETAPYLDKAVLSIAPLRFGAGMKGKVTEAMAAGLPVVTTTFGAQGLDAVSGVNLLIGDEPESFSKHVVNLLKHPEQAEEIGLAGQERIRQICSVEVVEKHLNDMISSLMLKRNAKRSSLSYVTSIGYRGVFIPKFILSRLKKLIKKAYTFKRVPDQAA